MTKRSVRREIQKNRERLAKGGITRDAPHTKRRIYRILRKLPPGFEPVRVHSALVKRLGNSVANALQANGIKVDRGLVNNAAIAHDSKRASPNQDIEAQIMWARKGAPKLGLTIGTGESWTTRNYSHWSLERKIVAWGDNICRGAKVGNTFVNGIVPSKTAYRLLVSQRQADPSRVDALTRERQAVLRFEAELRQHGLDPDAIVREQMKRNPKSFLPEVEKSIDSKVEQIIQASVKRLGIKKFE